ncbi:mate-domain-containing protein [Lentinula raphanica]|nr:mate-domain-containing protein [Lentinula raphanica]
MSTIETQHGAYLTSKPINGKYAVETTPLLEPTSSSGYRRSRSRFRESEAQDPREELPTLPLLVDQFSILLNSPLPVFGTHLLEYALLITSVLAVGHLGKLELAACTLRSMTANVTSFSIVIGMGGALDTVLPGSWGVSENFSPDPNSRTNVRSQRGNSDRRMAVLYLLLLVSMVCIWLNAEKVLVLLRQNKEVARLAGRYLAMLAFGLPAFSFNTIAKRYFQAQGLFSIPTKIGTIVAGTNVLLTGALVYYPHPLPRSLAPYLHLGFDGAPLATFISYNLVALGRAFWGWRIELARRKRREAWEIRTERNHPVEASTESAFTSKPTVNSRNPLTDASAKSSSGRILQPAEDYDNFCDNEMRPAWHLLSMCALHSTDLGTLLTLASEWSWELVGLAASLSGPTALAAQSVLLVSCSTTYQVPFALGIATNVRIGQLLGLARPRLAKLAAHAALLLGLALSLVFSAIFWIWRKKWAYVFNDDEDVAEMDASIFPLVALFQVAYYVLGVPLGVYLAFKNIGLPESFPDYPTISTQAMAMFTAPSSMPSPSFPLPSLHLPPLFNESAQASSNHISFNDIDKIIEDPMYPSLPEATFGSVDKVQARVQAEDRRNQQENHTLHVED